jgi:hypothetical protein
VVELEDIISIEETIGKRLKSYFWLEGSSERGGSDTEVASNSMSPEKTNLSLA